MTPDDSPNRFLREPDAAAASSATAGPDLEQEPVRRTAPAVAGEKLRDADKLALIPVKVIATDAPLRKPDWIRIKVPASPEVARIKSLLRANRLATVCEEANCPNLSECFSGGTATFMIMGDICTRRCPFCDVGHGKPKPLDADEPANLAKAIAELGLKYVVITSVDRDDLRDGGAQHFADCIREARLKSPSLEVEILTPDFRGRMDIALAILAAEPPNVFNHNLETVPRLYSEARPGAHFGWSLSLLKRYKALRPEVLTKSGLMLGLGETLDEVRETLVAMREHHIDMLTLGQYLAPSKDHLPVKRYVTPEEFDTLAAEARALGFVHVASGPLVRSSYHADQQAHGKVVR
jgi:lipoyl synthase